MYILWCHIFHGNVKALTLALIFLMGKLGTIVPIVLSSEGLLWGINKNEPECTFKTRKSVANAIHADYIGLPEKS